MQRIHLMRALSPAAAHAPLADELRRRGEKLGWLDYRPEEALPPPPEALGDAAMLGVLRAVTVGRDGAVIVKPRRGPATLRDLVREHFRGCRLVLIRTSGALLGLDGAPLPGLEIAGDVLRIVQDRAAADGETTPRTFSPAEFCDRLRRPSATQRRQGLKGSRG